MAKNEGIFRAERYMRRNLTMHEKQKSVSGPQPTQLTSLHAHEMDAETVLTQRMEYAIAAGDIEVVRDLADAQSGGGMYRLDTMEIMQQDISILTMLIGKGCQDDGGGLRAACKDSKLAFARLLLENFGTHPGYVNSCDDDGCNSLFHAVANVNVKTARLLIDYGVDTVSPMCIYPDGSDKTKGLHVWTPLEMVELVRKGIVRSVLMDKKLDAVRNILLQVPAARATSWCWPVKVVKAVPKKANARTRRKVRANVPKTEFSKMLVAMRTRASRKPPMLFRVDEVDAAV